MSMLAHDAIFDFTKTSKLELHLHKMPYNFMNIGQLAQSRNTFSESRTWLHICFEIASSSGVIAA